MAVVGELDLTSTGEKIAEARWQNFESRTVRGRIQIDRAGILERGREL